MTDKVESPVLDQFNDVIKRTNRLHNLNLPV